jgi:hypothetical protein
MAELLCLILDSHSPFANLFSRIHKEVRVVLCCAPAAIDLAIVTFLSSVFYK